ncbi:MAG: hypothetical protein ACRC0A_04495 [Chitinophagaceae bacterium]
MKKILFSILVLSIGYTINIQAQKVDATKLILNDIKRIGEGFHKKGNRQIGIRIGGGFIANGAITLIVPTSEYTRINIDLEVNYLNQTGNKYTFKNYNPLMINSIAGSRQWVYISPTIIKDWVFPFSISKISGFSWYAGIGGTIALGINLEPENNNFYLSVDSRLYKGDDFRLALGIVGNIGVEYSFINLKKPIPFVLSLDVRPTIGYKVPFTAGYGFHPTDVIWGSVGLGIKYLF